jgi:hypothetical protein
MPSERDAEHTRSVRASLSPGLNYVFHLLAVARVGFDSDYADAHASSVNPEDRAFLAGHRNLLTFGMGSAARLCDYFIWFPSFLGLDTLQEFETYVQLVDAGARSGDFAPLVEHYASPLAALDLWWQQVDAAGLAEWKGDRETIQALGQILLANFERYRADVWPVVQPELARVGERIEDYFKGGDHIDRWERITGLSFKCPDFRAELCAAIKNGPNANSISYERVVFFSGTPFPRLPHLISHEIGTHILIDLLKEERRRDRFAWPDLYAGCETLAKFYNALVIEEDDPAYDMGVFQDRKRIEIYRLLYRENPTWSPGELLERGLAAMSGAVEADD